MKKGRFLIGGICGYSPLFIDFFCIVRYAKSSMLIIRLQRVGRKNDPAYRLVVGEKRSKPQSGGHEILGSYHPKTKTTVLKEERILYWLSKGAKASDTAYNLLVARGVLKGKKRPVGKITQENIVAEKPSVSSQESSPAPAGEEKRE